MTQWNSRLRRHWATFEWYGISFYLSHVWRTTREIYSQDLRPMKWAFAIPSFGVAFWLWSDTVAYANPGFKHIAELMSEDTLGWVFFLHGIGLWWRIYSLSKQILWAMFFGALGMVIYFGYPIFVWIDIGRLTGQGIAMAGWGIVATWATSRLGTGEDRSGP